MSDYKATYINIETQKSVLSLDLQEVMQEDQVEESNTKTKPTA